MFCLFLFNITSVRPNNSHVMCKKCGIIIVKNRANQHDKRVHKLDVARSAWARADEVYLNKIAVDPRRASSQKC